MQRTLSIKFLIMAVIFAVFSFMIYVGMQAPVNQDDLCQLFKDHPRWYRAAYRSQDKWGVPISVQMAIIRYESHFRANAKPRHKLFGFIPWVPASSANGYTQALEGTWREYLQATHRSSASRANFSNATDFIGWYVSSLHRSLGLSKEDAESIYLAYHVGATGYQKGYYHDKPWLVKKAKLVQKQATIYHRQLVVCHKSLPSKHSWF